MTWFKVDDSFAFHPKVVATSAASIGLWLRAGTWSAANLTDGHIPANMLGPLGGTRRQASELVKVGLWSVEPDGYRFHDWSDYQPIASDVRAMREEIRDTRRAGAVKTNHQRWHVDRAAYSDTCPFCTRSTGR